MGKKEQRTNVQYGFGSTQSARRASLWHCIPCASVDYHWRVVFAKLLQATRNANSSLTVFLTANRCRLRTANSSCLSASLCQDSISPDWSLLLSVVDWPSASPFTNCLLWAPFSFTGVPLPTDLASLGSAFPPTSGLVGDLDSKPFVWFRTSTNKGIICLADHPHRVTIAQMELDLVFFLGTVHIIRVAIICDYIYIIINVCACVCMCVTQTLKSHIINNFALSWSSSDSTFWRITIVCWLVVWLILTAYQPV